ncbi:mitogen-activated protein kinase-like protein [Trypanosoma theileri]|uniref:Mitogen-activated protein kinase-like protein n=1 Tax=Trypanosoma theileri TaxID=67003 RepID=A0A1X0P833_9TRYP|nr:mitogen-activated protein kinase-like protein [Trypanosoma theileri]ORC93116.1 mitogen-activated protein kinase-like protein [Trypanosoma theileri]
MGCSGVDRVNENREGVGTVPHSSTDAVEMTNIQPNPLVLSGPLLSSSEQSLLGKKGFNSPRIKFISDKVDPVTRDREYKAHSMDIEEGTFYNQSGANIISSEREIPCLVQKEPTEGLKDVKKSNCFICILLLIFSVLIGVAGGIATGFVGYHYNMRNQRAALSVKNSIVLNSSVGVLHSLQNDLKSGSLSLLNFIDYMGTNFSTSDEMLDAYNETFFTYTTLAFRGTTGVDRYGVYIPFCTPDLVSSGNCPDGVYLEYTCQPLRGGERKCYYRTATKGMEEVYEVGINEYGAVKNMSWLGSKKFVGDPVNLTRLENNQSAYYLESGVSTSSDGSLHSTLTYQRVWVKGDRYIISTASGYTSNWFRIFDESLHKADISYAMIFDTTGDILAYSYGSKVYPTGIPCKSLDPDGVDLKNLTRIAGCGKNGGDVLDGIVDLLESSRNSTFGLSHYPGIDRATVMEHDGYVIAIQTFLDILGENLSHRTFFAAYTTPIVKGLDEQNALQIMICIVIVVVSICILGGVSLFSINQLQKTLQLVSELAVNVSTYDLEKMQKVLDRSELGCNAWFGFLGGNLLREEFSKILFNLKAYRPFLPQALLTNLSHGVRDSNQSGSDSFEPPLCDDDYNMRSYGISGGALLPSPQLGLIDRNTGYHNEVNEDSVYLATGGCPLKRLKSVKGTVIVIQLLDCIIEESGSVSLIDHFLAFVLQHVRGNGGVADHIGTDQVIATFNFHIPVIRHQQKACQCAIAIQEDCQKAELRVAIAIASGSNYVCTVGTDEQKARVVAGDSVDFAKQLVTLNPYLGVTILVTQQVAHASGVVVVPVDNVEVYSPRCHAMTRHLVLEVVSLHHQPLSPEQSLTKEVFHLILARQQERALQAVADFMRRFPTRAEVPWRARRLYELCSRNAALIDSGYFRRALYWTPLEGEAWLQRSISNTYSNSNNNSSNNNSGSNNNNTNNNNNNNNNNSTAIVGGSASHRVCDVERAKEKIDEHSQSGKRTVVMKAISQGEDALISVFLNDEDSPEEGDDAVEHRGLRVIQDSLSRPPLPRCVEDINQQIFYRTDELLGKGQFGEVYLAISSSGSFVATKVFPLEDDNGAALVREVEALIQLRHDHILTYDTCAIQDGFFFIFTEYMAAGNMRKLISRLGQIPEEAARKYSRDILYGLQFLHSMKYVHCDVKPDNVLLSSEGTCKLGDFGTVRLSRSLTDRVAAIRGTPRYMAPEAVLGNWTVKADVYSFGLTVAHMLLGHNPWSHYIEPDEHFIVRLARNTGDMKPDLPTGLKDKELESAIHSCCEFDPSKRPSVDDLISLLS